MICACTVKRCVSTSRFVFHTCLKGVRVARMQTKLAETSLETICWLARDASHKMALSPSKHIAHDHLASPDKSMNRLTGNRFYDSGGSDELNDSQKRMKKKIQGADGSGPPMAGVMTYPYKVNERLYYEDFSAVVAGRITHPFLTTAKPGGSLPFNILSGSNYSEEAAAGPAHPRWRTEQSTQYYAKTPNRKAGTGARTEQEIH